MARRRTVVRRQLAVRLRSERAVPLAVSLVVLIAGVGSLGPNVVRPVGAAVRETQAVRLAIGGGAQLDPAMFSDVAAAGDLQAIGGYVDDGTIWKPFAVDTTIETASGLLTRYTVKAGDSLTGIASKFGVSMMTIWWANNLNNKDELHIGQVLVIPPVSGLVVTVKAGDTLDSLGAKYKVDVDRIVKANDLTDTNLVIGQVLLMPGAKGKPIPTPKPPPSSGGGGGGGGGGTFHYTSGAWAWPVAGDGGGYISQYFSSYHPAIDIAAEYGTPLVAARPGRVVWAGWKSSGGGYQVWIDHGGGLYTNEMHMSRVLVSAGQYVSKGQLIGRIGTSGWATGPHVHLEVWYGYPWKSGSYRVNPLRYY